MAINFHEIDQPDAIISSNSDTKSELDRLKTLYGSDAKSKFTLLNQALDDTLTRLLELQQYLTNKKNGLSMNGSAGGSSVVTIPASTSPELAGITTTINTILAGATSSDISNMHIALAATAPIRTPTDISNFETKKVGLVGGKISAQLNAISKYKDQINTLKALVITYL